MAVSSISVSIRGKIAANVTSLEIAGQAISPAADGTYETSVQVPVGDRYLTMTTRTSDGRVETRAIAFDRLAAVSM